MAPYVTKTFQEELDNSFTVINQLHKPAADYHIKEYVTQELLDTDTIEERAFKCAMNTTVSRVHQAMESFIHNMNSIHSRGGNQVVFSSINYGTDTSAEGRCVIRELLRSTYRGVGNGATAIFPIQIFKLKKGVSRLPEDPNFDLYQLACKVTAKRFFPNFLNLDATFNQDSHWNIKDPKRYEHEVATMGCRTRVFENRFGPKTSIGRGNLSFTTINLVKIAIESDHDVDKFYDNVVYYSRLVAKQLHERFEFQSQALAKQFPLLMAGMWNGSENLGPDDTIKDVINQGTLGIGFIGLAEALVALIGKHHGESDEAQAIGIKAITLMKRVADESSTHYQHNYSVLATPAEGLSGKFTKVDKVTYGIIPGVTDKDYYTNSNHVPVYYHCTVSHKIEVEAPYHALTLGGHIFYVEIDGDATKNPVAIYQTIERFCDANMGYGSVNHFQSRCPYCNYETAEKDIKVCPNDGYTLDTLQRITGYLVGSTNRWNAGKLAELRDRIQHELK